ncbi:hypothetical protein tloyanaT_16370 [Thalassotalea loyana]|uniref:Sulfurtransferase complex subunit TusB n=1 Tax=Thalassotalea loyana TaxID=280483 RepID=A0ABQ6HD13_9GAMM|nr:sulfurtransferase complex subunit TusB [Thalassotalea loyana]GLX85385.1 hypothetical protein tloyanaT_16370 [Thalassotalea loyana]
MLHIVRQSPFQKDISQELAILLGPEDTVLLIDDGIYFLQSLHWQILVNKAANILVVKEHTQARGIASNDDIEFISLESVAEHLLTANNTLTWQ